jgi:hypothetical protein
VNLAQAVAEALKKFTLRHEEPALVLVEFVKGSLVAADILSIVLNKLTTPKDAESLIGDVHRDADHEPVESTDLKEPAEGYEIECVLRRQKRKCGDKFLVRWKETKEEMWVRQKDLSRPRYNTCMRADRNVSDVRRTRPMDEWRPGSSDYTAIPI